jgi:RNA recognition motif-containing protein
MARIYVGNINYRTDEAGLRDKFGEFGEVSDVHVVTDRETGRSRGFAFVEMPDDNQANTAIEELNGQEFEGRPLTVNVARPREDRGGRGGGGGGRRERRGGGDSW